jgi:tricorn protease
MGMKALAVSTILCSLGAACLPAAAAIPRFAQPFADKIVFVANGNVWSVGQQGGTATRLTSAPGQDMFPRVSPDGKWIAYTEASNAGTDVWVIPAGGGMARRLTYHPATEPGTGGRHGPDNMVVTWTPDSQSVVYLTKRNQWNGWIDQAYAAPVAGGPAHPLPLDSAVGLMTFSPDGKSIAYNRILRNFRTWKRYNGGLAQQVFTYDLNTRALKQITDWPGTNTSPMWSGNRIYYLSDQDGHRRANIWCYDLTAGKTHEVTHFTDYDIDFPALGGDAIAFQQAGKLFLLDLKTEQAHEVNVSVPDDETRTRPHIAAVKDMLRSTDMAQQVDFALAPNGARTLFSARGDIFSVPTEHGAPRNLTATQQADEDHPAWSPDGKTVAYTTDGSGNPQIAVRPATGGAERLLTHFATGYLYGPLWSPDGKTLAFSDGAHRLWTVTTEAGAPVQVAQDRLSEIHDQAFSPDGKWLAFSMSADNEQRRRDLYLYEIATKKTTRLGAGQSTDANPVWSPDGKYLYFTSSRNENTILSDIEFEFAVLKSEGIYAIPLAADTPSPVAPRSDEGDTPAQAAKPEHAKAPADGSADKANAGPIAPMRVDLPGMMARAVAVPVDPANIAQIDARAHKIFYLTQPISLIEGDLKGETSDLHVYDFTKRKDAVVASDVDSYALSADGAKVLIRHKKDYTVLDAKPDAAKDKDSVHKLDLSDLRANVDPRAEWHEMFDNAWRLERDLFFSPVMNGVNWQAVHDQYAKLLPLVGSREDLNWLIGEMLGEIGNSHTYVGGGDDGDSTAKLHPGLLGAAFTLDEASGRYKISDILPGDNTREDYRSPLAEPGLAVKQGDYLLAINGQDLRAPATPDQLLQTTDAKNIVDLTVADSATGAPRHVIVTPVAKEMSLREAAWIAHNRALVDQLSGGRVGYVYMSDMEQLGLQQFVRQFYSQLNKQALIMDDRWNGGGFVAGLALERLRRVLAAMGVNREGATSTEPNELVAGPKIALLNHWSASDGDIFPYLFKQYGLGPLLGTRSWGGVRGIRGMWLMMDGGYITIPEDAMYGLNSTWAVENHGVDPDIVVENEPADLLAGHDKQLETAVALMVKAIDAKPTKLPPAPALLPPYPPSGMVAPKP